MILINTKPTTASQRHLLKINRKHLQKSSFIKSKIKGMQNSFGKNNQGKTTVCHKGGGHKQKYRKVNFYRIENSTCVVITIEYDPNRTANIASIYDIETKDYFYILAPKNLKIGDVIKSGYGAEPLLGHSLPISKIPVGSFIHNISKKTRKKAQISRAAGTFSYLIAKSSDYCQIKISSGKQLSLAIECLATVGIVSNELNFLTNKGKAGRSRWMNKRPTVRGVAMNPIDHPHGGGEGKSSGSSLTPWGKPTKSRSTSRTKNILILNKK